MVPKIWCVEKCKTFLATLYYVICFLFSSGCRLAVMVNSLCRSYKMRFRFGLLTQLGLLMLSVWSEMQTCIRPSRCHCHSLSLASVKSRLILPFWYWLTQVVPDIRSLKGCVCTSMCISCTIYEK